MPIAEIKRLHHQVAVLDDHLYRQKDLLRLQFRHLGGLLTRRAVQTLRSPWAMAGAFALGLVAGRVVGRRSGRSSRPADNGSRFRLQTLLPLALELWPTVQTAIGQFAAGWAARKSAS
ncbi:MAG: hypothetical protein R3310_02865 [Candidatus Competibacteraceae bacterium]|nr:hypothetical protein [Candidatus Competibacteraceae bacterium]